ncbi:RpiR family transcriptional regulator [Pseudomonas solani]|uniref:RpiR family transcriptional regulator n=1 Tax=Pseudomonas solani TaxID=2731552 RepID=A0AAU7Y6V7_9PSED|nr:MULTISPECIES: MurR/RpiR family transcriptional regulator [Pseudomonas]EQM70432.1 RpiR family transcriptional regulator [Pseudomonas alcaligenes OT 69]MBB4818215.1 DNA-binding MurR/RpiR family transcriptional regulator [Pseudomonas alcaligenes]MDN4143762.1 MurR/RpiR family transcriptional regulator [Pseudomonas tohonis]MCU9946538.1 MurR/RpiR family transcriptional regulator [Pseudomonas sp. PDM13]MDU9411054.1 MurR/RpiR family transcriptional regulator [Pseudomonas sp. zfem005]
MLDSKVEQIDGKLTPNERTLWAYIQANLETIAFESGASLAEKSGVSPNTVSRFLRRLGYKGLKSLKEELRDDIRVQSLLNTTLIERVEKQPDDLLAHLNEEIDALVSFGSQLNSQHWQDIVTRVAGAERVFVCGFQTIRGLAEDFASRLSLVRSGVEFLDLYRGVLGQWVDSRDERCCVVLIDIAPYADVGIAFANTLKEDTDLVVFTDEYGIARHISTPWIVTMKTKTGLILESTGGLTSALNVLLHCVAAQRKGELKERLGAYRARVESLQLYRT